MYISIGDFHDVCVSSCDVVSSSIVSSTEKVCAVLDHNKC